MGSSSEPSYGTTSPRKSTDEASASKRPKNSVQRCDRSKSEDVAKREARASASARSSAFSSTSIPSCSKTRAVVLAHAVMRSARERVDPRNRASSAHSARRAWANAASSIVEQRQPYSPRIHASMCRSASGIVSQSSIAANVSTAEPRKASSSPPLGEASPLSAAAAPSSPLPSATRAMRFCETSGWTRSPASSRTRMTVETYHSLEGANRSAATQRRETRSDRRNSSVDVSRECSILSAMNSTFTGLIMR
mmetsp:Transcript_11669/g.34970  ORF Transcript_11669/g.34970 Transcript_11669/m.34970 type:complete len:251 (+) Transcript_11669:1474-2226(+)